MTSVIPTPSHLDTALYAYREHKAAREGLHGTERHAGAQKADAVSETQAVI